MASKLAPTRSLEMLAELGQQRNEKFWVKVFVDKLDENVYSSFERSVVLDFADQQPSSMETTDGITTISGRSIAAYFAEEFGYGVRNLELRNVDGDVGSRLDLEFFFSLSQKIGLHRQHNIYKPSGGQTTAGTVLFEYEGQNAAAIQNFINDNNTIDNVDLGGHDDNSVALAIAVLNGITSFVYKFDLNHPKLKLVSKQKGEQWQPACKNSSNDTKSSSAEFTTERSQIKIPVKRITLEELKKMHADGKLKRVYQLEKPIAITGPPPLR